MLELHDKSSVSLRCPKHVLKSPNCKRPVSNYFDFQGGVKMSSQHLARFAVALGVALSVVEPACATVPVSVPVPIVGVGLPGLAVLGGVYGAIWLTRKLRKRH